MTAVRCFWMCVPLANGDRDIRQLQAVQAVVHKHIVRVVAGKAGGVSRAGHDVGIARGVLCRNADRGCVSKGFAALDRDGCSVWEVDIGGCAAGDYAVL